jgi:single-strand DNA-binding protein
MKSISNSVKLIGNIGQEIKLLSFNSGSKKASVSLATTEFYKNDKGELIKNTSWHNLVAWGKNAELMARSLEKGTKVAIQGMLNYRIYTDEQGSTKTVTEILVSDFMRMSSSTKAAEAAPAPF